MRTNIADQHQPRLVHRVAGRPDITWLDVEVLPGERIRIALKRRTLSLIDPEDLQVVQSIAVDLHVAVELADALRLAIRKLEETT